MSLDLTPGHGNLLGESYWEILSPWLGGSWMLNTGVSPREGRVSSLSAILEDSPPRKYYLSRKACRGILRRARERGKPLPPQLEAALKAQAGLTVYVTPIPGAAPVTVLAETQRDGAPMRAQRSGSHGERSHSEMSELPPTGGSEGYGACGDAVADCLNPWDTQQARITTPAGVSPTINSGEAKPGGLVFAAGFCAGAGPSAGSIGYHEEVAPTLKGSASGNMMPSVLCLNDQGGSVMECSEDISGTLRAQEHGHQPLVFENHGIDARYTGPHEVTPTLSARAGTGGNNLSLVMREEGAVFCITGNAIDRQPENGGNGLGVQEDIAYTLTATDHHAVFARQRCDKFQEGGVASTQSSRQQKEATDLVYQEVTGPLTASDCKGPNAQYVSSDKLIVEAPLLIRRLTPRECERLQGYPDDWTALPGAADSPRYRALGNSVAIPCVEYLMHGMALVLRAG